MYHCTRIGKGYDDSCLLDNGGYVAADAIASKNADVMFSFKFATSMQLTVARSHTLHYSTDITYFQIGALSTCWIFFGFLLLHLNL